MVPRPFFDKLLILVAGGVGEKSMVIPVWHQGKAISREVSLPYNWQDLIKDTEDSAFSEKKYNPCSPYQKGEQKQFLHIAL